MTIDRPPFSPPLPGHKPAPPEPRAPVPGRKPGVSTAASGSDAVNEAVRLAAGPSGHSFRSLLAQAAQESGLNPKARNTKSSAVGPFQFIERTWLDMIRRHGAAYGLGELARAIQVRDGAPAVKDPALRKQILALREDPHLSAGMAARYLAEGREALQRRLGRSVSEAESRIAYIMGPAGASRLIQAAEKTPGVLARDLLPTAAKANKGLFYADGKPLPVKDMVTRLTRRMESDAIRLGSLVPGEPEPIRDDAPGAPGNPLLLAQEAGTARG